MPSFNVSSYSLGDYIWNYIPNVLTQYNYNIAFIVNISNIVKIYF